jgi:hypothetical protein
MQQSYLREVLEVLRMEAGDIGEVRSFDDLRKVTLRMPIYDVFLLERLAVHLGIDQNVLGRELLAASLTDAADFLEEELYGSSLKVEGDKYMNAWRLMKHSQEHFNNVLARWCSKREARLESNYRPVDVVITVDEAAPSEGDAQE